MKRNVLFVSLVLFLFLVAPFSSIVEAANFETVFELTDHPGGSVQYSLTVSVTTSLFNYYQTQNHDLFSSADFDKFVTPYAVKPIADALWRVYPDDETFADAILGIAQQIPYQVSSEVYPVETLKLNYGDCGSLSLLAASIMKAGGLDVVLLEYPSKQHLNLGVNLSQKPVYVRSNVYYVDYHTKRYYIAESTGDNFPNGWRVGECPTELKDTSPTVIPIEDYETTAPGQVSASYDTLAPSQVSISVSSTFTMENSVITIAGLVTPSSIGNISIYISTLGGSWQVLTMLGVDGNGHYVYQWRPQSAGVYAIGASWSGNQEYAAADSAQITLYIIPFYGLVAGALGLMLLVLLIAFWLINRRGAAPPPTANEIEPSAPSSPENQQPPMQESNEPQPTETQEEPVSTQETQPVQEASPSAAEETAEPQQQPPQENSAAPSEETPSPSTVENEPAPQSSPQPETQPQEPQQTEPSETPAPAPTEPTQPPEDPNTHPDY